MFIDTFILCTYYNNIIKMCNIEYRVENKFKSLNHL